MKRAAAAEGGRRWRLGFAVVLPYALLIGLGLGFVVVGLRVPLICFPKDIYDFLITGI
jgi:hypothetical protein